MKRFVGLLMLIVMYAHCSYSQNEKVLEKEGDTILLKDIVIEENRLRVLFSESNKSTSIILEERLKEQPIRSFSEALSGVAGVDVRSRGVAGMQADLSIRGSTFDENLVLLNGVKLSDPQTGHHLMNLPINFQDIQRIEILKGAAARIYGQNAYSGAVNVITKMPETKEVYFSAYGGYGQADTQRADTVTYYGHGISVGLAIPSKVYNQYISYGNNKSNGHRYNSDFEINNLYYQSSLKLGGSQLNFQAGYSWRNFGANGFYAGNNEFEDIETGVFSLDYETGKGKMYHRSRVYWRTNNDNYKYSRTQPGIYQNIHRTNAFGAESHFSYRSDLGYSGFGIEIRHENISGIEKDRVASNPLLNDDQRTNLGVYLEHRYESGRFSATPGVYINNQSDYGLSAFPGIDLGFSLSDKLRLFTNLGRTYRVPTFFDLYYSSATAKTYGNPNLKPGVANNYEIGLKMNTSFVYGELTGFYVDSKSTIDWVYDPSNPDVTWQAMNFNNVDKYGIETSLIFNFKEKGVSFLEWLEINYTHIDSDLQDDNFKSRYATVNLKHQFNFLLTHRIFKNLKNTVSAKYRSRPDISDSEILTGVERFDNYLLLDTKLFYQLKKGQIFLEATNILDEKYIEVGTVVLPGRWFRTGVTLNFGY